MNVIDDLLARGRRSRNAALETVGGRERTYYDLITNAHKAANVFRYLGVRRGSTVAVDPMPRFHTILAFLGAAALGAAVRFDPTAGIEAGDRAVLINVTDEPRTDPKPGTNLVVFGGPPERPETTHWETELWSENPMMPPTSVDPDDTVMIHESTIINQGRLFELARSITNEYAVNAGTRVVLRTNFAERGAVAAGLVAPLSSGATTVLRDPYPPHEDRLRDSEAIGVVSEPNSHALETRRVVLSARTW